MLFLMASFSTDWAFFGGTPALPRPLPVGRPHVGNRAGFLANVARVLDSGRFTNHGPCVQELEASVAALLGVRHCVAVCNATVGLQIAISALGWRGEVILPSMTFVATAHALRWLGVRPVFADVGAGSHNIDAAAIEALITPATSGILGVHLWGRACDTQAIDAIAARHGLSVLYDAAHAFGCSAQGRPIGGFGSAEVFSFHATKFFSCFEGGAITTNDDALAERLRQQRNFGFAGLEHTAGVGTNGKMSEVCAAMGLAALGTLDDVLATNRSHHALYAQRLAGLPGVEVLPYPASERNNHQYMVIEYTPAPGAVTRDELVTLLWAENVHARKYFAPGCHRLEPYCSLDPRAGLRLPRTEALAERLIALPAGAAVASAEVHAVCDLIERAVGEGTALGDRLRATRSGCASVPTPPMPVSSPLWPLAGAAPLLPSAR
jgi:dTDP-4-amino-4,6-dideoxygalactose transaminase